MKTTLNFVTLSAAALLISACAVHQPATVSSDFSSVQAAKSVELPSVDGSGSLQSQWRSVLASSFGAHKINIEPGAPFIVDFALSSRAADAGLAKTGGSSEDINWQSAPRSNRILDRCEAQTLRGTMVIFRRSDGQIVYRGESESIDCKSGQSELENMANKLVSDALR